MDLSASNQHAYTSPDAVSFYANFAEVTPAEEAICSAYHSRIVGSRLLDLGVGGGRTTVLLAPMVARYVGIDYVPELIAAARARCPAADLRVGDARDLSDFADDEFDIVVFSFNGLDYVPHADRGHVLTEIRRVLRSGGLFVFSTHNLDVAKPVRWPTPGRPRLSRRWLSRAGRLPGLWLRHAQMRRREEQGPGWAVLNDEAHDYQLLTHYITRSAQEAQLAAHGFEVIECRGGDGHLAPTDDRVSYSLYFVAG